jgi:ABC-type phosphate transport system auxiliary subunit
MNNTMLHEMSPCSRDDATDEQQHAPRDVPMLHEMMQQMNNTMVQEMKLQMNTTRLYEMRLQINDPCSQMNSTKLHETCPQRQHRCGQR